MKKCILVGLLIVLLCSTTFAGSLGSFTSSLLSGGSSGGGGLGNSLGSLLDGCCSESSIEGFRSFLYGIDLNKWYFSSPWNYNSSGSMTVPGELNDSKRLFLFHSDFEWRYMPATKVDEEIMGYRTQAKLYSVLLLNLGFYYQHLWQDLGTGFQEDQSLVGMYITFGGWITKNFNIDFGVGLVAIEGDSPKESAGGVSANADGTIMAAPGLMLRWSFSYTWFETNHLIDAEISLGYIVKIIEFRIGAWMMETDGADELWGPYAGLAIWI